MKTIQPVRGTHDIFSKDLYLFNKIIKEISKVAKSYDFNEIITPIFEKTDLFEKPLGEHSDVVLKEMYTFIDRNESSLTLRPEYTTPMIRASISNNMLNVLPAKLYGIGPMFRRERPQKGRYRQFNQINFEILGSSEPITDAEIIILADQFLKNLKIKSEIKLFLNSLGDLNTLRLFKEKLATYYQNYKNSLSKESQLKIEKNPIRILDSKNPEDIKINLDAPKIKDLYTKSANQKFDDVKNILIKNDINFEVDENLVRGLDYYCHTVFEFKDYKLGSKDTIIGGGRYDGLVKTLGGPDIPGVGWAGGVERLMMIFDQQKVDSLLAQLIIIDSNYKEYGFDILFKLRNLSYNIKYDYKFNLKKSLKQANELNIKYVIIIGENEFNNNFYTIKNLKTQVQTSVNYEKLIEILES